MLISVFWCQCFKCGQVLDTFLLVLCDFLWGHCVWVWDVETLARPKKISCVIHLALLVSVYPPIQLYLPDQQAYFRTKFNASVSVLITVLLRTQHEFRNFAVPMIEQKLELGRTEAGVVLLEVLQFLK